MSSGNWNLPAIQTRLKKLPDMDILLLLLYKYDFLTCESSLIASAVKRYCLSCLTRASDLLMHQASLVLLWWKETTQPVRFES